MKFGFKHCFMFVVLFYTVQYLLMILNYSVDLIFSPGETAKMIISCVNPILGAILFFIALFVFYKNYTYRYLVYVRPFADTLSDIFPKTAIKVKLWMTFIVWAVFYVGVMAFIYIMKMEVNTKIIKDMLFYASPEILFDLFGKKMPQLLSLTLSTLSAFVIWFFGMNVARGACRAGAKRYMEEYETKREERY